MDIQTVAQNLRNTIAGKEAMLATMLNDQYGLPQPAARELSVAMEFVEINIEELKKILADVEQCIAKDVEQSWRDNPDRSGGQFTQDEINDYGRWI